MTASVTNSIFLPQTKKKQTTTNIFMELFALYRFPPLATLL